MGGQVISLLWKDCSDGCSETNCDSMQNGGITFIFTNKETFSFSATFFKNFKKKKICLLLPPLIKAKMFCVLWNWEACGHFSQQSRKCGWYKTHFIRHKVLFEITNIVTLKSFYMSPVYIATVWNHQNVSSKWYSGSLFEQILYFNLHSNCFPSFTSAQHNLFNSFRFE